MTIEELQQKLALCHPRAVVYLQDWTEQCNDPEECGAVIIRRMTECQRTVFENLERIEGIMDRQRLLESGMVVILDVAREE